MNPTTPPQPTVDSIPGLHQEALNAFSRYERKVCHGESLNRGVAERLDELIMAGQDYIPDWFEFQDGENLLVSTHPHVYVYWEGIMAGLAAILLAVWAFITGQHTGFLSDGLANKVYIAMVLVGVLTILAEYIHYKSVRYILTDQRVIKKTGILSQNPDPITYRNLADMDQTRTWQERLFGASTIQLYSKGGTDSVDTQLKHIPKGPEQAKYIQDRMAEIQNPSGSM